MFLAASVSLTAPSSPSDRDRARLVDAAGALERGDLVLPEQEGDALGRRVDHLALALHELGEVELRRADLDAVHGEIVARLLEQVRGLQQRLGRDAADIEAGAAEGRALLDHRHLHAELGGADRRHIAAGTGADHDEVEGFVAMCSSRPSEAGVIPSAARDLSAPTGPSLRSG